ncbi:MULTISPECIES: 23S rRNA (adenine(2030)-N(6))-methyltransferase RlmJ [unclassified Pseudomonas]|uniref:23S rRNA (adenine(2030)-N(6))-methyltransferase RlmJ n=1 Tax=unclassified Pseudomonas TaxID=196821 RepID=UPI000F011FD0|nr:MULTISPECIES: 23S rRNA (adenine(2030)-N(6))-methyltransferase RlmJ [unclassified Pseudomonas]MBD8594121.1 23S rRNA (adenine(2030)-N(6))-methyltransferase RlmJ [Pseudomonas sp. CFBP 8758]MBD8605127.1 23S rRNA (adenine(2030)-N(6))-methyltransferase RlmJ [Pseudomonas sp. CFBP 8771]MBD8624727.1 23S rRNA (adenine(2030)-N(6))-methyltransferase RlmJ [Pseudomonas sp. CFBP 13727]MBD8733058.1 23S rRNA (adenine(2030)-N(6))-methyltransferase RlmJ [Pseudomonas sp. CFBP 13710]
MNYRHAFHAGNHADVFKHIVLTRLVALMSRKEQPFAYLDTHAGLGLYDLRGDQATRTGEWLEGIARLWQATDRPALTDDYVKVINRLNTEGELRYYPGSPELARRLMRQQDRVLLNEKHPEDGQLLKENMKKDPRVAVHLGEGWHVPRALLPVAEKRAVMLIDPPFEQLDELKRCATALKETIGRMRQTVAAIWYPIKDDERALKRFYQDLTSTGAPKLLRVELLVHPLDTPQSLNGSGLVIANPPWGLEEELRELMPWLANLLGQSQGGWKMDWLIAE